MPDITMCPGGPCPDKLRCYRHMAEPSQRLQSYSDFAALLQPGELRCAHFLPTVATPPKLP